VVSDDFNVILQSRLSCIQSTLAGKAKEYAGGGDRLHNFKVAARISGKSPEEALQGMMLKHLVSVFDLIEDRLENTSAMVNEKIGDTINYLILLEAVLAEARVEALTTVPCAESEEERQAKNVADAYKLPSMGEKMQKQMAEAQQERDFKIAREHAAALAKATMRKLMPYD